MENVVNALVRKIIHQFAAQMPLPMETNANSSVIKKSMWILRKSPMGNARKKNHREMSGRQRSSFIHGIVEHYIFQKFFSWKNSAKNSIKSIFWTKFVREVYLLKKSLICIQNDQFRNFIHFQLKPSAKQSSNQNKIECYAHLTLLMTLCFILKFVNYVHSFAIVWSEEIWF